MIRRLRPAYSPEELAAVYAQQYDHTRWSDHVQRIAATVDFIHTVTDPAGRKLTADLSCGDAAIARAVQGVETLYLGDYVHNPEYQFHGRIEATVEHLPHVDLFILSETLEHIDDPGALLRSIRASAGRIIVTTPLDEQDAGNPEHYWGWDADGIRQLLEEAGWDTDAYQTWAPDLPNPYYTFQMWSAV